MLLCACSIICFTCDSTCFGVSAARLTRALRTYGMRGLVRQDVGYFDFEENSAGEITTFLAQKVDTPPHLPLRTYCLLTTYHLQLTAHPSLFST